MGQRVALLWSVAKASLQMVPGLGAGVALVELLPEIARQAWHWWQEEAEEAQRAAELEAVARAAAREVREQVEDIVRELAPDRPAPALVRVYDLLSLLRAWVRQTLRRPADPSGRTVAPSLVPGGPEQMLALLPTAGSRFRPGDRPLAGADLELVELLGGGGFGEVWKATNPNLPSAPPVALKLTLEPGAARSLRNEAAILDRVMRQNTHPGIVRLQQTYLSADPPCLQYEYVEGGDLAGLVRAGGLPPDQAAGIIRHIAGAVGFAHRLAPPIVHRDLKPANVLTRRGADGQPEYLVTDFGISGAASESLRQASLSASGGIFLTTALAGSCTPLYASPQQLRGGPPDTRDDVYAMGVIWYQLLTGDLTAKAPSGSRWRQRLGARGMSGAMIDLLAACVEDDPGDRPADAAVLASELVRLLTPPAPSASPASKDDAIVTRLTHRKWDVRRDAVSEIGQQNLRAHAEALAERLRVDDDDDVRLAAFKVLDEWGLLTDELYGIVLAAGDEQARLGHIHEIARRDLRGVAPALAERLRDDGADAVRLAAFHLLLKWAEDPGPVIASALGNSRPGVRRAAIKAARGRDLRGLTAVLQGRLSAEADPETRMAVFSCLLAWDQVDDSSLRGRLVDPSPDIRLKAIGLAKSRDLKTLAPALADRARADQTSAVRSAAFGLLLSWGELADDTLPEVLADADDEVRRLAAWEIGRRDLRRYAPALRDLARDEDEEEEVRAAALRWLIGWGEADESLVRCGIEHAYLSEELEDVLVSFLRNTRPTHLASQLFKATTSDEWVGSFFRLLDEWGALTDEMLAECAERLGGSMEEDERCRILERLEERDLRGLASPLREWLREEEGGDWPRSCSLALALLLRWGAVAAKEAAEILDNVSNPRETIQVLGENDLRRCTGLLWDVARNPGGSSDTRAEALKVLSGWGEDPTGVLEEWLRHADTRWWAAAIDFLAETGTARPPVESVRRVARSDAVGWGHGEDRLTAVRLLVDWGAVTPEDWAAWLADHSEKLRSQALALLAKTPWSAELAGALRTLLGPGNRGETRALALSILNERGESFGPGEIRSWLDASQYPSWSARHANQPFIDAVLTLLTRMPPVEELAAPLRRHLEGHDDELSVGAYRVLDHWGHLTAAEVTAALKNVSERLRRHVASRLVDSGPAGELVEAIRKLLWGRYASWSSLSSFEVLQGWGVAGQKDQEALLAQSQSDTKYQMRALQLLGEGAGSDAVVNLLLERVGSTPDEGVREAAVAALEKWGAILPPVCAHWLKSERADLQGLALRKAEAGGYRQLADEVAAVVLAGLGSDGEEHRQTARQALSLLTAWARPAALDDGPPPAPCPAPETGRESEVPAEA